METITKLKLTGVLTGMLLIGAIAFNIHKKRRDEKAALFFSELERNISPGTVGLAESDAFDMHYWQNIGKKIKKSYYLLKELTAKGFANDINSAWGIFDDDEDKIYGVLRALKDQVAVSQVAYWYYQKKKVNLIDELNARLTPEENSKILKIVNNLPAYRIA